MKCNDTKLNITNINKEGDLAETPLPRTTTLLHSYVIIQKKVFFASFRIVCNHFQSISFLHICDMLKAVVFKGFACPLSEPQKYLEMFLVLFGFDLSVALCCTDEVPCNYVTSSLYPPQMHHTHPGTINLCLWLNLIGFTFKYILYFVLILEERLTKHVKCMH